MSDSIQVIGRTFLSRIRPECRLPAGFPRKTGRAATHVEDFEQGVAYTNVMDATTNRVLRLMGRIKAVPFGRSDSRRHRAGRAKAPL